MLAAELPADLGERRGCELLDDVHSNLAREGDGPGVAAHLQVLLAEVKMLADALLDQVDGDAFFLRRDDVAKYLLRGGERNNGAGERSVGHQARQGAF